jgi:glycosyltransferase involved in cell wall biosynthesis
MVWGVQLPDLTVIVPVFNDGRSAEQVILLARQYEGRKDIAFLVVDNGSDDPQTQSILREQCVANVELLRLPLNSGFGGGIASGIAVSRTSHVCWMPGNLKVKPADAVQLWDLLTSSNFAHDAIKASRRRAKRSDSFKTFGAGLLTSMVYAKRLFDSGGTPTLTTSRFMKSLLPVLPKGYEFELFTLYHMRRARFNILRPKVVYETRRFGTSHWQTSTRAELSLLVKMLSHRFEWNKLGTYN